MNKREEGFTLVELIITMFIFVLILAATSNTFVDLLKDFKKQSKQAETNIEGAVGLEILRRDIESAGYGLAWNVEVDGDGDGNDWEQLVNYCEAATAATTPDPATFNNGKAVTGACTTIAADPANTVPKAVQSGNDAGFVDPTGVAAGGADYLSIKSTTVATNATAQKWTYLRANNILKNDWTPDCENVNKDAACDTKNTVRVIVINPGGSTDANTRSLITSSATAGVFYTQYDSAYPNNTADFDPPTGSTDTYMVYGVDSDTDLRMPFNRADYFIRRVDAAGTSITPTSCAPNTGVLEKAVVNQGNGAFSYFPLLDCVADMQVVYALDNNEDGEFRDGVGGDAYEDDISTLTAKQIRTRVKEIRVYILAQEGQRDTSYTSPATIVVGPVAGRTFDLGTGTNRNYRWKVYTIVVRPNNLR